MDAILEAMGEQQDAGAESRSKINNNSVIYETLTSSQAPCCAEESMGNVYNPPKYLQTHDPCTSTQRVIWCQGILDSYHPPKARLALG